MRKKIPATVALFWSLLLFSALAEANFEQDCHIGAYRLSDGRVIDIAPADDNTLRWRMFTGETGRLHPQGKGTWTSTYGWTDRPDGTTVSFPTAARVRSTLERRPAGALTSTCAIRFSRATG